MIRSRPSNGTRCAKTRAACAARLTRCWCVGEMLAKMEREILFAALARRVRRFVLDGEPIMRYNNTLRGWNSIPLRLESAPPDNCPLLLG
jgi:hypothetical protein